MSTKHSPLSVLKKQADQAAKMLKAAERGLVDVRYAEKICAARKKPTFKFAVIMDDKILTIEMAWTQIRDTSETGLSEWIVKHMRESRETLQ